MKGKFENAAIDAIAIMLAFNGICNIFLYYFLFTHVLNGIAHASSAISLILMEACALLEAVLGIAMIVLKEKIK